MLGLPVFNPENPTGQIPIEKTLEFHSISEQLHDLKICGIYLYSCFVFNVACRNKGFLYSEAAVI